MTTFNDALLNPNSRKLVFVRFKLKMELFAWVDVTAAHARVWYVPVSDITDVLSVAEDDSDLAEAASLTALDALSTGFFWDFSAKRIYVKTAAGPDIYNFLYIATVLLAFSKHGGEYLSLPHDAAVTRVPSMSLNVGEIFNGKVARIGGGGVSIENASNFFSRNDVEIDGRMEIVSALETLGGA